MQIKPMLKPNVTVLAPAKINLSFDIVGRRDDGYHDVVTLYQAIDLWDILSFYFSFSKDKPGDTKIALRKIDPSVDAKLFPLNKENSIIKAIDLFLSRLPEKPAIDIEVFITKGIPIGAGLAGGSTDAAAALIALNTYFDNHFNENELINLASQIGSDVAFCLIGGLALGRGRGELLEKTGLDLDMAVIIVKPRDLSIPTPWAYNKYDQFISLSENSLAGDRGLSEQRTKHALDIIAENKKFKIKTKDTWRLFSKKSPDSIKGLDENVFWNAFEPAIFEEFSLLAQIKERLLNAYCIETHLTGSGPTIYALAKNEKEAKKVIDKAFKEPILKTEHRNGNIVETKEKVELDIWLTKCFSHGAQVLTSQAGLF